MATVMINSNNEKALFLSLYWALKTSFLTQIHADITQIHADFSDETICDHLRLTLRLHSGSMVSVLRLRSGQP